MALLENFHFLRPWWLLFMIPATFIYWLLNKEVSSISQWRGKMSEQILQQLIIKGNDNHFLSPKKLLLPLLFLVMIVLAGPSWYQQASPFSKDNSVLIIALDLSPTMNTGDIKPTRLLRAKQKINTLLDLRGDANTALIAFAGSAHIVMPISQDRQMIRHFLQVLNEQVIPVKAKNQITILPKIDELTSRVDVPTTVLLVTDATNAQAEKRYREYFKVNQHKLIVWSMNKIEKKSREELKQLALSSQGVFVQFDGNGEDIKRINDVITAHMTHSAESTLPWYDSGYYLVFILMAIHLLWFRKGWTLKWS